MSYDKQTWATGDTITANKLNHMEDGIAAGGGASYDLIIESDDNGDTATGLPFDELFTKCSGENVINANVVLYSHHHESEVTNFVQRALKVGTAVEDEISSIIFSFNGSDYYSINENETAYFGFDAYTWTYDGTTKTYTLTPSENSGGGAIE